MPRRPLPEQESPKRHVAPAREPLALRDDEAQLWDMLALVVVHGWLSRGILGESEPIADEVGVLADDIIRERRKRLRKGV